jgi:hypothetical protein
LALIVVLPSSLFAGIENRPLNSDEATVLPRGQFVVATGASFVRQPNNDNQWNWVTDLEAGVFDWLELDVELPYTILDRHIETEQPDLNGWGDVAVQLEGSLLKERAYLPGMSMAFQTKTQSANEDRGLGSGETDYTVTALASKTFGHTSAHLNLGLTVVGDPPETDSRNTFNYNVALEHSLSERLLLVGELFGRTNQDRSAETDPLECLMGVVYSLNKQVVLDAGIGMGVSPASPDLRLTTGLTVAF